MTKLKRDVEAVISEVSTKQLFGKIRQFNHTGASYEEWINWELYLALVAEKFEVEVRPRYNNQELKTFADLRVNQGKDSVLIETKVAHSHTQDKYIWEVRKDSEALAREMQSGNDVILALFLSSNFADIPCDECWREWLAKSGVISKEIKPSVHLKRQGGGSDVLFFVRISL